jgi:hypothetical protein
VVGANLPGPVPAIAAPLSVACINASEEPLGHRHLAQARNRGCRWGILNFGKRGRHHLHLGRPRMRMPGDGPPCWVSGAGVAVVAALLWSMVRFDGAVTARRSGTPVGRVAPGEQIELFGST